MPSENWFRHSDLSSVSSTGNKFIFVNGFSNTCAAAIHLLPVEFQNCFIQLWNKHCTCNQLTESTRYKPSNWFQYNIQFTYVIENEKRKILFGQVWAAERAPLCGGFLFNLRMYIVQSMLFIEKNFFKAIQICIVTLGHMHCSHDHPLQSIQWEYNFLIAFFFTIASMLPFSFIDKRQLNVSNGSNNIVKLLLQRNWFWFWFCFCFDMFVCHFWWAHNFYEYWIWSGNHMWPMKARWKLNSTIHRGNCAVATWCNVCWAMKFKWEKIRYYYFVQVYSAITCLESGFDNMSHIKNAYILNVWGQVSRELKSIFVCRVSWI